MIYFMKGMSVHRIYGGYILGENDCQMIGGRLWKKNQS